MHFNTCIAFLMDYVNTLYAYEDRESPAFGYALYYLMKMLAPFAPHLAEELWRRAGHDDSVFRETWEEYAIRVRRPLALRPGRTPSTASPPGS